MASIDLPNYIDLDLVDKDPQDVFDNAVITLRSNLPEWSPREGNQEVLLLEALSGEVAEAIFAINRLPDVMTEVLLSIYGVERDYGDPPVVTVQFEMGGSIGYIIPAGTNLILELEEGFDPVVFSTDEELNIPAGETSGTVNATGDRYTSEANGIPLNTILTLEDTIQYVNYARTLTNVNGGRDVESDEEYLSRGVQRFQRLSTTLVTPAHFASAALENLDVSRVFALDNYNPANDPDNNGPIGNDAGHVTVAVYGENEFISTEEKELLRESFEKNSLSILTSHVIDPTITTVNVDVSITIEPGADYTETVAAITEEIESYLNPMNWPWGSVVRRNELISRITNVPGVDYVESLIAPATNITLSGVAPLADLGTLDVAIVE